MDVRLSPEQQALRDAVAHLVDRRGPRAVGRLDDHERRAKLDAAVAAAGWRDLRVDNGGRPLAAGVDVAVVTGEMARGLTDAAYMGPVLAADLRRLAGLPPADEPETIVLDHRLTDLACTPVDEPVRGVAVDAAGAVSALGLRPAAGGHHVVRVALAAGTRDEGQVDLTRLVVPVDSAAEIVADGPVLTDDALTAWRTLALVVTAADLVGVMQGAVDLAAGYAAERRQYGAAIGSFQAIQHLLADALVATEGSRSTTLHAAWAIDALDPDEALAAAATAKAYASRAARTVCETAIQVHGGIGNTWECMAHVFLRRALLSIDVLGGTGTNLDRVLAAHGIEGS